MAVIVTGSMLDDELAQWKFYDPQVSLVWTAGGLSSAPVRQQLCVQRSYPGQQVLGAGLWLVLLVWSLCPPEGCIALGGFGGSFEEYTAVWGVKGCVCRIQERPVCPCLCAQPSLSSGPWCHWWEMDPRTVSCVVAVWRWGLVILITFS